MSALGDPNSPARARALMLAHSPHIRHALGDRDPSTLGAVILAADVPPERASVAFDLLPELHTLRSGAGFAIAHLEVVRALATELGDPEAARHLAEPVTPGYVWVLVVLPRVVACAPLGQPEPSPRRAQDDTETAAFLQQWPATAHLAARLDPTLNARGETTFRLAAVLDVFEEFVRIVDATDIAPEGMRAAAENIRAELPGLREEYARAARRTTSRSN